jgi:hypothetical protein
LFFGVFGDLQIVGMQICPLSSYCDMISASDSKDPCRGFGVQGLGGFESLNTFMNPSVCSVRVIFSSVKKTPIRAGSVCALVVVSCDMISACDSNDTCGDFGVQGLGGFESLNTFMNPSVCSVRVIFSAVKKTLIRAGSVCALVVVSCDMISASDSKLPCRVCVIGG